jgi:hypothetical protein
MFHVWHPTLRTMSQQLKMLSHQLIILKTVGLKDYLKKKTTTTTRTRTITITTTFFYAWLPGFP